MNAIEGTVLVEALIALRSDELEPHDTLECIGWRTGDELERVFSSSLPSHSICDALLVRGLLERKEDLYRLTETGIKTAMAYVRDPARFRNQTPTPSEADRLRHLQEACEPLSVYVKPEVEFVNIPVSLVKRIIDIMEGK